MEEKLERIKRYAERENYHYTDNIADLKDDDRIGNANQIANLEEYREHWRDILRIIKDLKLYYSEEYD